ncbi:MAG: carbohydrate-binding protein [Proteobacteria bacterium]|nr:carbohydrate-binding protein [Pseudomonadota bacterium]
MASNVIVVDPIAITEAMIVSTDVVETDYTAWNGATNYTAGTRCIRTTTHKIYENAIAGIDATLPEDAVKLTPARWLEVSATNRHKCFDTSNASQTVKAGGFSYRLHPGQVINSVNVLNADVDTVRVRMVDPTYGTVYDYSATLTRELLKPSWSAWHFSRRPRASSVTLHDLPNFYDADILIDVTVASGDASVGVILIGYPYIVGEGMQRGARVGIDDYSKKTTDAWGTANFVEGAWAKKMSFITKVPNTEIDSTELLLASLRAKPSLVIAADAYACTKIFGWIGTFEILIAYSMYSECSLDVKGLT